VGVLSGSAARRRRRAQPWIGGLTKLNSSSEWVIESGRAPLAPWWSKTTWNWSQASSGRPAAKASAVKQLSQLQTLFIQCFDISTAGRATNPSGSTAADQMT
jgi:hypothetical protein